MPQATSIAEITITEARKALSEKRISAVELVSKHLERVAFYDRQGLSLNAIPTLNSEMFSEAAESDRRYRLGGSAVRSLEGIPFTVKDSYMVKNMTVVNGSPAFVDLISSDDAFIVKQLRDAGAILIGKTTMPPMAAGGMQRGAFGRAESPYNTAYLAAAYASGSSNGSGASTAASMALFGMGSETYSSGRSPASNNSLCAYTPSRGLISVRGIWPLFAGWDVAVPHTRSMSDLLEVVKTLMFSDTRTRGDFWRTQSVIKIPQPEHLRPDCWQEWLEQWTAERPLEGKRFGVPRMYIGKDPSASVQVRPSVLNLWERAKRHIIALGGTVVECDFPAVKQYEGARPMENDLEDSGIVPKGWMAHEYGDFMWWTWDDFLRSNAELAAEAGLPEPVPSRLEDTNGDLIFPLPRGALPDRYDAQSSGALNQDSWNEEQVQQGERHTNVPEKARAGLTRPQDHPDFEEAIQAIENLRQRTYDTWLKQEELDGLVFPTNGDVGRADADKNPSSADDAWKNGVLYSNGNLAIRHLGIPTVTVPMGVMDDTGMPVGVTFTGLPYQDMAVLGWAYAFDSGAKLRARPNLAPALESDFLDSDGCHLSGEPPSLTIDAHAVTVELNGAWHVRASGRVKGAKNLRMRVTFNGVCFPTEVSGEDWRAEAVISPPTSFETSRMKANVIVVVLATDDDGGTSADYCAISA